MTSVPTGYFYTKQHEWAREESGLLLTGITDFAQKALGDIVYVDLKPPGSAVKAGDAFGTIESVKAAEDLYSPVNGTVDSVNKDVNNAPESINKNAQGIWLVKFRDYGKEELNSLMDAAAYTAYIATLEQH